MSLYSDLRKQYLLLKTICPTQILHFKHVVPNEFVYYLNYANYVKFFSSSINLLDHAKVPAHLVVAGWLRVILAQ